jgi:hypothetical protein
MSLRHSPALTSASLTARRANACKSTGPRTSQGKARASLNALKHGRYALRLPERLAQAGCPVAEARWHAIRDRIARAFSAPKPVQNAPEVEAQAPSEAQVTKYRQQEKRVDQLANWVWCAHRGWRQLPGIKLESLVKSEGKLARLLPSVNCTRLEIRHPWARRGIVFYTQRRRGWKRQQVQAMIWAVIDPGHKSPDAAGPELESGLRSKAYRLGKPRYWERIRYCLDREGYYHPEWQGECRRVRRELRQAGLAVLLEPPHPRVPSSGEEGVRGW